MTARSASSERPSASAVALPWLAAGAGLYLLTAARGLVWADASKLTLYALGTYVPSLNPGDHAGWTVLAIGWLRLIGGEPVLAAHWLSAVTGALVPALAAAYLQLTGASPARVHTAASVLLVAHPIWWASTSAETYAPALAATLAGAVVLSRWNGRLAGLGAGLSWGLASSIHALSMFLIVPLVLGLRPRHRFWLGAGFVAGTAPVWLGFWFHPLDPLTGLAASTTASWGWHVGAFLAASRGLRGAATLIALLTFGLGPLAIIEASRRQGSLSIPGRWLWSLSAFAVLLSTYAPFRLHLMAGFLLAGLVLAVPIEMRTGARIAHLALQSVIYVVVPWALVTSGHGALGVRQLPHRVNAYYFLLPVKVFDHSADRYVGEIDDCAPPDSTVLADFNPGAVLRLAQVARGWRRDITVRPVAVDIALGATDPVRALEVAVEAEGFGRPVVLADRWEPYYHLAELAKRQHVRVCTSGVLIEPVAGALP